MFNAARCIKSIVALKHFEVCVVLEYLTICSVGIGEARFHVSHVNKNVWFAGILDAGHEAAVIIREEWRR